MFKVANHMNSPETQSNFRLTQRKRNVARLILEDPIRGV